MSATQHPCICTLSIPFKSHKDARIVVEALSVDEVLSPQKVNQLITCDNDSNIVTIKIDAVDEKMLRLCVSGILDMAIVASQTLDEFSDSN
jgi:tRNA threonylcarbamoyladenosine modification (KEOPS) complex  Pcc1 subunit